MSKLNKYTYYAVIQGNFGFGWEDVDHNETNSAGICKEYVRTKEGKKISIVGYNIREYRNSGIGVYRIIYRKETNKS
jgi:hypothetical protein